MPSPHTDCSQNKTLLHFAVRHGLNCLSQYLLSLPGAAEAVVLPDTRGQLPIDIARSQGNEGLAQLLIMYVPKCLWELSRLLGVNWYLDSNFQPTIFPVN